MKIQDLIVAEMTANAGMMKMTLADFTDADMLVRPTPDANHAAWQLGHLIRAETNIINGAVPGVMPELPAGFADRYTKATAKSDQPADFASRTELLDLFEKTRNGSIAWARSLSDDDLVKPSPENLRRMAPAFANLAMLIPGHSLMHIGQFQVLRRKLGKPVLF
jgi:DinB superfamily